MKPARIYLSPPHMSGLEKAYVDQAFDTNWIAPLGPNVDAFEREFCAAVGCRHAAALSSGTAALHLSMLLSGVSTGDEVIVSTFTFSASVNPILYAGGHPTFVDSEAQSWNMDANLLDEVLTKRARQGKLPKAVVVVHLYGQSADLDPIRDLCNTYGVTIIEDAAESLGATYKGRATGTFGQMAAFSFNGNKIITTSGGGMLVSDDESLISRARKLATQARENAPHYEHAEIGFNYRMSNVLAGIGRGQLQVLPERVAARRRIFAKYVQALSGIPGIAFMPEPDWSCSNRWLTCITLDPARARVDRETIRLALEAENIESRPLWKPMHLQPVFKGYECTGGSTSAALFERGLCLPSGSSLSDADLDRVVHTIRSVCANA
jgi:pyridoxal phosphate-dependent aminotransferase EpsN